MIAHLGRHHAEYGRPEEEVLKYGILLVEHLFCQVVVDQPGGGHRIGEKPPLPLSFWAETAEDWDTIAIPAAQPSVLSLEPGSMTTSSRSSPHLVFEELGGLLSGKCERPLAQHEYLLLSFQASQGEIEE